MTRGILVMIKNAETAQVKEEVSSLVLEMSQLKQKLEETTQYQTPPSRRARIPRDLSVSESDSDYIMSLTRSCEDTS